MLKIGAIIIGSVGAALASSAVGLAQQSDLTQQIKPIECVYTTTEDGTGTSTNSSCDDQPIPTLTEVKVNNGKPLLRGEYAAARASSLRVWLNGQWFTLNVDSRLTTQGNEWTLNLTNLSAALIPGVYKVMVEAETNDGLLLRNTNAGSFIVPVRSQNPTSPVLMPRPGTVPVSPFGPGVTIPTILPRTQEGVTLPGGSAIPEMPQFDKSDTSAHQHHEPANVVRNIMYSIGFILLLGGGLWAMKWWRSR